MGQHRAILDGNGVYQGHEPLPNRRKKLRDDEVGVPADCDLEPGRYCWNGETMVPMVQQDDPEEVINQTHTLLAVACLAKAVRDHGIPLPAITERWLAWYDKTVDGAVVRED